MADIDVVKKGSRTWLWVVLALIVLAALFFMMGGSSGARTGSLMIEGGQPLAAAFPSLE